MSENQKTAKINITLTDEIGLGPPTYSKIKVGASVTRDIPDEGVESVKEQLEVLATEIVEPFIASERAKVLKWVQSQSEQREEK